MNKQEYFAAIEPHYSGYQELHTHTDASFNDAVTQVSEIVAKTKEFGRNAFSITDHGNQMRLFHGFKARTTAEKEALESEMKAQNIPEEEIKAALKTFAPTDSMRSPNEKMWSFIEKYPEAFINAVHKSPQYVPGIELYFQPEKERNEERYHIILLACDWQGQKELFKIENLAQLNPGVTKDKMKPVRTTFADLERLVGPGTPGHGHIIGTSACVAGYIPSLLLQSWNISDHILKYDAKIAQANVLNGPEDLEAAQKYVEECAAAAKVAAEDKKLATKAAKTDYPAKLLRLHKQADKLEAKLQDAQTCLWGSNDAADEAAEKFDAKRKEIRKVEEERDRAAGLVLEDTIRAVEKSKEALKAAKENVARIEKEMRPIMKLYEKIDELEEQRRNLGDTFAQAKEAALHFERIFGKGYFYIELQDHGIAKEHAVFPMLEKLVRETGIPPTVANDIHFASPDKKHKRDMIAAMRFNNLVRDLEDREGMGELYFKTDEQMAALRPNDDIWRQGMENTSRIAEKCNVYYEKAMHLPDFDAAGAGFDSPKAYLESYCRSNIPKKYPMNALNDAQRKELMDTIEKRLVYELDIIEQMGFSSYIAIVQDFIFYGRKIGGPSGIGPGRGSAAGSIVCYLADITDIDPLRFNLLFEREKIALIKSR